MEGPMVSYLTGAMNSVVRKLAEMKNPPVEIGGLRQDLETAGQQATNAQVREWMKQVRELVFDIEDWIDQKPGKLEKEDIEKFKTRIQEARNLCRKYELLKKAPASGSDLAGKVTIDSRLLWGEKSFLVALKHPKQELKMNLKYDEQKKLKVVSIVGVEGLGKTTLAKEIHGELLRDFRCGAFVYIGRNPSIRKILMNILHQVMSSHEQQCLDEQHAIAKLWGFLQKKRYFIVLDGLWSIRAWRIISCAFPDNNCGSRILTTTRFKDVAESCSPRYTDVIHQMEALSKEDSRILFLEQAKRPSDDNILNLCCGMPLAIIVAAGLLPSKLEEPEEAPKILWKSINSSLDQYSTSQAMTKILHMSYANLSVPMRSCFLYLGVFPEDYTIKKDRLIRLWEAEGFIPDLDKASITHEESIHTRDIESLCVTGVSYFNELINRRLIKPVFNYDDDQAAGCTVHGVILDFIRSLSREENFGTTAAELIFNPFSCDAIQRFSLDCSNEDEADILVSSRVHLSSTRSLTVFGNAAELFDPFDAPSKSKDDEDEGAYACFVLENYRDLLSSFKLLRVLDLEDSNNLKEHHLKDIGGLVLLRYLGLGGTNIFSLPEEIGNLEQLETLDVRRNRLYIYPPSLVVFKRLVRLLFDGNAIGLNKIWENTRNLEELSNINLNGSSTLNSVEELLSKSKRMRILGVNLDGSFASETRLLFSFLKAVRNSGLHSLSIHCHFWCNDELVDLLVDSWEKVTAPLVTSQLPRDVKETSRLQRFELTAPDRHLRRVPPKMASLASLTHLHIKIEESEAEGIRVLGGLPNLILLNFSVPYPPQENFIIEKDLFPSLKVFSFTWLFSRSTSGLEFAEGAMPQLRRLGLSLDAMHLWDKHDFGIQHLTCLVQVHITINCSSATVSQVEAAEAYIRTQVSTNPNKPTLELSKKCEDRMKKDEGQHSRT